MKRARVSAAILFAALVPVLSLASTANAAPAEAAPTLHDIVVRTLASGGSKPLPLRDATVRIVANGKVVAGGAVGSRGMALIGPFERPPKDFEVIVSGGRIGGRRFGAHLLADVHGYRSPRTVHVDPVTTLAARYATAHPRLSRRRVARSVKRFLKLTRSYAIGLGGRADVGFDGRRFLAAAGTGRHYERFVAKLVAQMNDRKARRSFARSPHHGVPAARHASAGRALSLADAGEGDGAKLLAGTGEESLGEIAEEISERAGFFELLEKGTALLEFANAGLAIANTVEAGETRAEIEALSAKLSQVQETLAVVQETVDNMQAENRKSVYSLAAAESASVQAAVESGEDTLASAAELELQEGCRGAASHTARCEEIAAMLTGRNGFVANMEASGLSAPGQVNAYAKRIAGDALQRGSIGAQGLIQDASDMISGGEGQLFFTPPQSAQLRSVAAYWITSYAEAVALASTFWDLDNTPKAAFENDVEQVAEVAAEVPAVLPSGLEGGAAIDMRNGTMWSTRVSGSGTTKQSYDQLAGQSWEWDREAGEWVSGSGTQIGALGSERPQLPFSNWRIAGAGQIHELQNAVSGTGGRMPGSALFAQGEFSAEALIPFYRANGGAISGYGLEWEYTLGYSIDQPGCKGKESTCVWPVWAGDEEVTDFNRPRGVFEYTDGTFEVPWWDVEWTSNPLWGWNNEETLYGPDPIGNIPYVFYRPISEGECYYFPTAASFRPGSPGCAE